MRHRNCQTSISNIHRKFGNWQVPYSWKKAKSIQITNLQKREYTAEERLRSLIEIISTWAHQWKM